MESMSEKPARWITYLVIDLVLIVLFAALGRREHEHGLSLAGILETAAPFLMAYLVMALLSRPWLSINKIWPAGVLVWIGTVAFGIALRLLFGSTAAVPFIIIATIVLGVFLLGRRVLTKLLHKRLTQQGNA